MKFLNNRFVIATTALLLTGGLLTASIVTAQNRSAEPITPTTSETTNPPAVPVVAVGQQSTPQDMPPPPEPETLTHHNLGSRLDQLVEDHRDNAARDRAGEGRDFASAPADPVPVTIYFTDHRDDIVAFLNDNGGDLRNVRDGYIEAYVPVPILGELSEQPGVIRVRDIRRPATR